jgi:Large extracellular alpha-helical protein
VVIIPLFTFTPDQSGQYEIQVSAQGSSSYVARSFYAYGMGNTQYSSFEVNNEGNVTIKSDQESYAPGENINLLFTTPFEGRMLVTIERNKVLEHHF